MAGRKWKHKPLVQALQDDELYYVARIVKDGEVNGLFDFDLDDPSRELDAEGRKLAKKRARSALSVMTKRLPEPDGEVEVSMPYRAFFPAWLGSTWKKMIRD